MIGKAVVMAFLLAALAAQPAGALETPSLNIVLSSQSPYPVQPGGNVDVEVSLQNLGYWRAENVAVEVIPKEPFALLPGQDTRKTFTGVEGLQSRSITYRLAVDRDAVTSSYDLELRVYSGGGNGYSSEKVVVKVQGVPDLVIEGVKTDPDAIEPGSEVKLEVAVKNVGTGTAHDVVAEFSSSSDYIVPLLGKGSVYLGELPPGQAKTAGTLLSVDSSAEEQTYSLTLEGKYNDENNTATAENFTIGLPVRGAIIIDVINMEASYARGVVKIEIANKGTADAKSLEAKLVMDNRTAGVYYVSQLKATKKTTIEFPLVLKGSGILAIDYTGPGIEKNSVRKEVVFNFEPQSSGDGTMILVYIVITAVAAYVLYRKFWKKRK
jgi:hypothetical protein